ncbi:MAG: hypothetical protein QOE05_2374 [Actinomycetota bacterium]|nr:hypothetical protein [Actinomycetota bacterium]
MRTRTALVAGLVLVAGFGSLSPAMAKGKTVTKSYTATAATPGPTNAATSVCEGKVPGSYFDETFKAPFKGKLMVDQTGFQGDWDLGLFQDGALSSQSAQDVTADPQTPEHIEGFKLKKGEEVVIRSCNFAGGPTASLKYVFQAS